MVMIVCGWRDDVPPVSASAQWCHRPVYAVGLALGLALGAIDGVVGAVVGTLGLGVGAGVGPVCTLNAKSTPASSAHERAPALAECHAPPSAYGLPLARSHFTASLVLAAYVAVTLMA